MRGESLENKVTDGNLMYFFETFSIDGSNDIAQSFEVTETKGRRRMSNDACLKCSIKTETFKAKPYDIIINAIHFWRCNCGFLEHDHVRLFIIE